MDLAKHFKKKFLTGLFILIPLLVTVYILYLVVVSVDAFIAPIVKNITFQLAGREMFIPGTGLVLLIFVIYLTGVSVSNYAGKRLLAYGEMFLKKIPFVKGIYSSVKDITDAFSSEKRESFKEVVLIEFPCKGNLAIGFITNRIKKDPDKTICSVFIPTTPNPTSGYLVMVPEKELTFLDMTVDNALKYIISFGIGYTELPWKKQDSSRS